ncbi:PREDICTED: uncharacterized protein LOC108764860 [Trachymyrmex cornetzi]|uniref:uncharacterized protein LOC108764860 n=1 Tax=Trachymyrmex cornetzi TaxID=471704 RepID=UPI00084F21F0|nr:PREDICTED: uncharacterized protein LOC108764860 [Trachymyrmex cornetzi]
MSTDPIELLFGAEVCSVVLQEGLRKGGPQASTAQNTLLVRRPARRDSQTGRTPLDCHGATLRVRTPIWRTLPRLPERVRRIRSHGDGSRTVKPDRKPVLSSASWRTPGIKGHNQTQSRLQRVATHWNGESLNSQLLIGANLLPPLADVLMRWRWHRYAIVTDIEKMYHQILVHPDDQRYQRILWRHVSDPIREFSFKTVIYGLACAPFLAIRTLCQLADDEGGHFPRGADALRRDCYVDDIVTGVHHKSDAVTLQAELRQLCMAGGFSLRKWATNCKDLLRGIPTEHRLTKDSLSWEQDNHSTLGLRWYPKSDEFVFSVPPRTITTFTKRSVLAETARLFDPLVAKSKVAPIKPISLPRLELCAAALLTNLLAHTRTVLDLSTASVTLWSDSKVTFCWIHGHASRWKTYVANRVWQIQQQLPEARWRHVPGKENPADCASRGLAPSELLGHPLWWTGPAWLRGNVTEWPCGDEELPTKDTSEQRATTHIAATRSNLEPEFLLRFSALHSLLRITSWCLRWRRRPAGSADEDRDRSTLHLAELDEALLQWIRVVQTLHYPEEMTAIATNRCLPRQSRLRAFSPYMGDHGMLRVGGRLKHAALSFDERHPLIVPTKSWLTRLMVEAYHRRTLHGGVQLTLEMLRLHFWIPRGRAVVKQWLRNLHSLEGCHTTTSNGKPSTRTSARPFLRVGIDYAGPILVRTSKGRGHSASKAFIAIFVCFSSKAVHLEAVSDYTAEAFLAVLRRFTSRRDLCSDIYSDCGINFSGADEQLREMLGVSSSDGRRIAHAASSEGIHWHFNPPSAPHFGGLWEAAVKSTKYHLRRVIGETRLTFEVMSTLLA